MPAFFVCRSVSRRNSFTYKDFFFSYYNSDNIKVKMSVVLIIIAKELKNEK